MNDFGFIDYKAPLGLQNDMRTAEYLGHIYETDTRLGNHIHVKYPESVKKYEQDPKLTVTRISENQANYAWKFPNPNDVRNPSLDKKVQFIKTFHDRKMKFLKRTMRPPSSVTHSDFLWRPEAPTDLPTPITLPAEVQTTRITINRTKPGFSKYLDPSASSSRLDFVHRTPEDIMNGVGAHDNITFWNWDKIRHKTNRVFSERDEQMCTNMAASECPKRRCEFPSLVKHVPHTGMTTEVRENYLEPHKRSQEFDITYVRNKSIYHPIIPFAKKTEYGLYGSNERTQKYIKQ